VTVVETVSAVGLTADPRSTLRELGIGRHMPQAWAPSNGYVRKVIATVATLFVILATLVAIPIAAPGLAARANAQTDDTGGECGIDMTFVLDHSGSMENDVNGVASSINTALATPSIAASGSQVGFVKFALSATVLNSGDPMQLIAARPNWASGFYQNPGSGWTNWDAALDSAIPLADAGDSNQPNVLIFVTDGNPNHDDNDAEHSVGDPKTGGHWKHPDNNSANGWGAAAAHSVIGPNNFDYKFGVGVGPEWDASIGSPLLQTALNVGSENIFATGFTGLADTLSDIIAKACAPKLEIDKKTNDQDHDVEVPVGGDVTWTYKVTNKGPVTVTGIKVTDSEFAADQITCTGPYETPDDEIDGELNHITGFSLAPGQWADCEASGVAGADPYTNTGTATGDGDVTASDDSNYIPISPDLTITKTADQDVYSVGDTITYTVAFTNSSDTENIVVDQLTDNIDGSVLNLLEYGVAEENTCNTGAVDGGADATITVPPDGTSCSFSIVASFDMPSYGGDECENEQGEFKNLVVANDEAEACESIDLRGIQVEKSAQDGTIYDGDTVQFDVKITNLSSAETVTINTLTENFGSGSMDLTALDGFSENTCAALFPDLELAPDGSVDCYFTLEVASDTYTGYDGDQCDVDGRADLVAAIGSSGGSETPVSDEDCAGITINERPEFGIEVIKTVDPGSLVSSGNVTWSIEVRNTGTWPLTGITFKDLMSSDAGDETLASCEALHTGSVDGPAYGGGILGVGESLYAECDSSLSLAVNGTNVENTATAMGDIADPPDGIDLPDCPEDDGYNVCDEDSATVTIGRTPPPPSGRLAIDKLVWDGDSYEDFALLPFGTVPTWQIEVSNPSTVTVSGLSLNDAVAPACQTAFTTALPGASLAAGASVTFTCTSAAVTGPTVNVAIANGSGVPSVTDSATVNILQVLASGVIGDRVWYDLDDDGVQDANEVGITGATVRITGLDGQDVDPVTAGIQTSMTMLTGNDGKYLFSGLPAGNYKVDTQLSWIPDPEAVGLRFTTPSSFTITLPDGGENLTADFGVVSDELAHTGLNTDTLLIVAILLMIAGAGAVLVTRRRKDNGEDLAA